LWIRGALVNTQIFVYFAGSCEDLEIAVPPFLVRLAHPPSKASVTLREPIDPAPVCKGVLE
jgi:hypothetical protein